MLKFSPRPASRYLDMDWATSSLPNTYMEGSTIASETRGVPYAKQVRVLPVLALNEVRMHPVPCSKCVPAASSQSTSYTASLQ